MKFALIGLLLVAAVVGVVLWDNQGSRLVVNGTVAKVRLQKADDDHTVVVMELRVNNPSELPFEVKNVAVQLTDAKGDPVDGVQFREADLKALFEFYKATLGPRYNPSLRIGDRIKAGETADRTVAASFPIALGAVEGRRQITIRLGAIDGRVVSEIRERP